MPDDPKVPPRPPRVVEFEGRRIQVPGDFTDEEVAWVLQQPRDASGSAGQAAPQRVDTVRESLSPAAQAIYDQRDADYAERDRRLDEALAPQIEAAYRRDKAAFLADALGEYAKAGGTRKQFEAAYDVNNPDDMAALAENVQAARASKTEALRAQDPGWLARGASDVVEGMTAGAVDFAKAGEVLRGGTGEATDLARAEQGPGGRLARAVLQTGGAALTMGAAGRALQALGVGPRVANVAGMAGYGAAAAPPGERLEGAATMAALGTMGGAIEARLAEVLPRLPLKLRGIASSSGGNVLAGYLLGQDSPEEVVTNAVLGAVMRAVDTRPDVTEADLRQVALEAAHAQRAQRAEARVVRAADVDRRIAEIDQRNADEALVRRQVAQEQARPRLPAGEVPGERPALPRGRGEERVVTVAAEPPPPPGYTRALEIVREAPPGHPGYSRAHTYGLAALDQLTVPELRAEAKALGLSLHTHANKAMLAWEILAAAERAALIERGMHPSAKRPPVLTTQQAGEVKAEYVRLGGDPAEVYSPERAAVAAKASARGHTPAEVAAAVEALPPKRRPDGTIAAGYKPTEQALAEGLIEKAAVPAVVKAHAVGIQSVSSGTTPEGRGLAIGVDTQGQVRRVEADAPPVQPEGRASERGFAAAPAVGESLRGAARLIRGVLGSELTRVKDQGGHATAEAHRKGLAAVDEAKVALGRMAPALDDALKAAGGLGIGKARAAYKLAKPFREGTNKHALYLPFIEMIEGRRPPATDAERAIVEAGQRLILARGALYEAAGVLQETATGTRPFTNRPNLAPRVFSGEWEDFLRRAPLHSPEWRAAVDAWTEATSRPREEMETLLRTMREGLADVLPPSATRSTQAEMTRDLPRIPHAIQMPHLGQTVHVLEPSPARYFKRLAERGAARLGVIKAFGQDIGQNRPVEDLRQRIGAETGDVRPFMRAMKALHDIQPGTAGVARPGGGLALLGRGFNAVMDTAKNLAQTSSAIVNLPENLGVVRSRVGTVPYLKALGRLVGATANKALGRKTAIEALELQGKITKSVLDVSLDPSRPASSALRIFNEVVRRTPLHGHAINEANERWAALAFEDFVQGSMRAGKNFGRSYIALRGLGYADADARRLARGQGEARDYDRVVRELVSTTTSSNLAKAQRSTLENSRLWNVALWFSTWAFTRARSAANFARAYVQSMERVVKSPHLTAGERWGLAVEAQRRLVSGVAGVYVTGTATKLLASLVVGGPLGLAQAWHDTQEDVAGSALDAVKYALIGGPFAVAWHAIEERGDTTPADYLAPVAVMQNVIDFVGGEGTYHSKPADERWRLFLRRTVPGSKGYNTLLVAFGLGNPDAHEMAAALTAFHKWRRENIPGGAPSEPGYASDNTQRWRTNMRGAYEAMVHGRPPAVVERYVYAALGVEGKDPKDVRGNILGRRLLSLPGLPEAERATWQAKMRRDLAPEIVSLIESHDELLSRLAASAGAATGREPGRLAAAIKDHKPDAGRVKVKREKVR